MTNLRDERDELLRRLTTDVDVLREENERLKQKQARVLGERYFSDLIGDSESLRNVVRRALDEAAHEDFPVLIYGETGTGKRDIISGNSF